MSTIESVESGLLLRVVEGSHQVSHHPLTRSVVSIGRSTPETPYSEAYLTFPEPTLSRLHAVLMWEAASQTYSAHHRSQTNPTLLNGRPLTKSQLLKPGDCLALGRLVVVLEVSPSKPVPEAPRAISASPPTLAINVKGSEAGREYSIPVKGRVVDLVFTDSRTTAAIAPEESEQGQLVRLPAVAPHAVRFDVDSSTETAVVEIDKEQPYPTCKRKVLPFGTLEIPLRVGAPLPIRRGDVITHQGYRLWLAHSENEGPDDGTLEGRPQRETVPEEEGQPPPSKLLFLNGAWSGAALTLPETGSVLFDLGQGARSFGPDLPMTNCPNCTFTVHDGEGRIRVNRVADDQFVDVNGELLFTGESAALPSGSRILIGEHEFVWLRPHLHQIYSRYQLVAPDGTHAVGKASVRLGTAAHCEVRFHLRELAPVIGMLTFSETGVVYTHRNLTFPAKVDGVETSAGLEAAVRPGSKLELAPGVFVHVEEVH